MLEIPEGWEEIPNFRRSDRFYNVEVTEKLMIARRSDVAEKSLADPRRVAWWNGKIKAMELERTTAHERWADAAKIAVALLHDMEKSQLFTSPERLQVVSCIAILEDHGANVNDKRQAVKQVGEMFAVFSQARQKSNLDEQEKGEVEAGTMKAARAEKDQADALKGQATLSLLEGLKGEDGTANVG